MSKEKVGKIKTRTLYLIRAGFVQPELLNKKVRKRVNQIFAELERAGAVVKVENGYAPSPNLDTTKSPFDIVLLSIYQKTDK